MSINAIWQAVFERLALRLKYEAYVHRHAVPSDSEKKAWPRASRNTSRFIFEKSGLSRKSTPCHAPGNMHEAMTMMMSRMNSVGMSRLETFSMPLRTPFTTTRCVSTMNATVHTAGMIGSVVNSLKYSAT